MNFLDLTAADAQLILSEGKAKSEHLIKLALVELLLLKILDIRVESRPPLPHAKVLVDYCYLNRGENFVNVELRKQYRVFIDYFLVGLNDIRLDRWASHIHQSYGGLGFYKKQRLEVLTEKQLFNKSSWGSPSLTSAGAELKLEIQNAFRQLEELFKQASSEKVKPLAEQVSDIGTKIILYDHFGLKEIIEIRQFAMSQVHSGAVPERVHFYYDKILLKKLIHSADKINSYFTSDTTDKSLYGMLG